VYPKQATALAGQIRAARASLVLFAGIPDDYGAATIGGLRRLLGPSVVFLADDAFLAERLPVPIRQAQPFYLSVPSITGAELPAAGRAFVAGFRGTQPGRASDLFSFYAAEATDVLLQAIAHSNGTRTSVVRQLLRVRIKNGILGTFGFDRYGDITVDRVGIYRLNRRTGSPVLDRTITLGPTR
jgi:ABC-type branched-subunit amino acid transport system substrate-binding protein